MMIQTQIIVHSAIQHTFFYTVPRGGQIETCEEREELEAQRGTL